jgi:hypothetical protein
MSAASSVQSPPLKIDISYQSLIKQLQETDSNQVFNVSLKWKRDTKAIFVGKEGPTPICKNFMLDILKDIIDTIKRGSSLYDMEMMSKIHSFLTTWEEESYPGLVIINKDGIDAEIHKTYYDILLSLYESRGKSGFEKLIDPSIFVNADGSLNLGNTPLMAMLRDLIRGCKRGTNCDRKNPDHLTFMHRLPVSDEIRLKYGYSSAYPVKGGKRRYTRYRKKTKASKRKTQKKSRKQRS